MKVLSLAVSPLDCHAVSVQELMLKCQRKFAPIEVNCVVSGNKGKLHFNLNNYTKKSEVLAAVDTVRYLGENTNTTGGLKVARLEVFDTSNQRPYIDRIIVLITDGVPTYDADKLGDEVGEIKRMGIRILGLGVTNKVILLILGLITTFTKLL